MIDKGRIRLGIQAGLLAGVSVVALFFLLDLGRLQPLATPIALSARLLGPANPALDLPVVSHILSLTAFAGNVVTLTLLHFLAFGALGVLAVWSCEKLGLPLNLWTGAVFGLSVGTLVFFGCMALCGSYVLDAPLGVKAVAGANLVAGMVLGGFVDARSARP